MKQVLVIMLEIILKEKKIGIKDAFRALYCIIKFGLFRIKK